MLNRYKIFYIFAPLHPFGKGRRMNQNNNKNDTIMRLTPPTALSNVLCLICLASASIGCSKAPADLSNLEDFIKHSYPVQSQALTDTVDLFIDYSSCVAQAKNSNWYNATHPPFHRRLLPYLLFHQGEQNQKRNFRQTASLSVAQYHH